MRNMNIVWTYLAAGVLLATAASIVVGGEAATAELRLVDAASRATSAVVAASQSPGVGASPKAGTAVAASN
jgi:hypothetical protein